jgi:gas vesicle protein
MLGGLMVGAVGGFLVGMAVAPKASRDADEHLSDSILDVRERTQELLENVRGNTETLLNSTRAAIEEKMSLLNEAVDAGRRAAEYKRAELIDRDDV